MRNMIECGRLMADVITANPDNFRIFGPDETKSNRLNEVSLANLQRILDFLSLRNLASNKLFFLHSLI
ncbi:MAG: hypothetical protein ACFNPZ_03795 [Fusobacterium polymorphum]